MALESFASGGSLLASFAAKYNLLAYQGQRFVEVLAKEGSLERLVDIERLAH